MTTTTDTNPTALDIHSLARYASTLGIPETELYLSRGRITLSMALPYLPEGLVDLDADCEQCDRSWFEDYPYFPGFAESRYPNPIGCGHGIDYSCAWFIDHARMDLSDLLDETSSLEDLDDAIRDWILETAQQFKGGVEQHWVKTRREYVADLEREADLIVRQVEEAFQQGAPTKWGYKPDEYDTIFDAIDDYLDYSQSSTTSYTDSLEPGRWAHEVSDEGIFVEFFYIIADGTHVERLIKWPPDLFPQTPTD